MKTQLERDLAKRISEKHNQWIMDAFDLYEMAGLRPATAARNISWALFHAFAALLAAAEDPKLDEFSQILKREVARLKGVNDDKKSGTGVG